MTISLPVLSTSEYIDSSNNKSNGLILYKGPSFISGKEIIVIAIGFERASKNSKTGDMIQIYILPLNNNPMKVYKSGEDAISCGDCQHKSSISGGNGTCYVRIDLGPNIVYKSYLKGNYIEANDSLISEKFKGRKVRFGTYGEPVLIPIALIKKITDVCIGWTGYSHQWQKPEYQEYKKYLMASVDSQSEQKQAIKKKWRTFRIRRGEDKLMKHEFICPASKEGNKRLNCDTCLACNGGSSKANVAIKVHGLKHKIAKFTRN